MLVPDSESGKEFAGLVKRAVPTALTVPVRRDGDRPDVLPRTGCLRTDELVSCCRAVLPAYYQLLANPQTAPHSRYDVTEWMPLSE